MGPRQAATSKVERRETRPHAFLQLKCGSRSHLSQPASSQKERGQATAGCQGNEGWDKHPPITTIPNVYPKTRWAAPKSDGG